MAEEHAANPDEVERIMRNLCAYALSEPDPLQRYLALTHQQAVFAGVVAALQAERGQALAEQAETGMPLDRLVAETGLQTAAQVRALVKAAGRTLPRASKTQTARATRGTRTAGKRGRTKLLPPTVIAPNGSRVLTPEERAAIGLPAAGSPSAMARGG